MRKDHHRHTAPADCAHFSPPAGSSAQQAAAAWAWFEHGGSSCITPSKAEGLIVAATGCGKLYNYVGAGPSRFKKEILSSARKVFSLQDFADHHHVVTTTNQGHPSRRRHSFDQRNHLAQATSDLDDQSFSSSCRSKSGYFQFSVDGTANDNGAADNEEGQNTKLCQNEACSLLDKFEVEALRKQLHDRLSRHNSCRSPAISAEMREYSAHHDHPLKHLKLPRDNKSCNTAAHKPTEDNDHHHSNNSMVHRLLHLHIKISSDHSSSVAPAPPFFCSSIATANSIVDRHRRSPRHFKAETTINRTATGLEKLHKWGIKQTVGKVPNRAGKVMNHHQVSSMGDQLSVLADEEAENSYFTLPPRVSALSLSDYENADKPWRGNGVLALPHSKRHSQIVHGDRVHHIHHHHHHHYYHLQQTVEASVQDSARGLLRDLYLEGHNAEPKKYSVHKDQKLIMTSGAANRGEGRTPRHHESVAGLTVYKRQQSSKPRGTFGLKHV